MRLYVHSGGQQIGPLEEAEVARRIQTGELSLEDLAIREGETQWIKLRDLFPQASSAHHTPAPTPAAPAPVMTEEPRAYRKTLLHKIFYGLVFIGALLLTIGAVAYWKLVLVPSGNLQTDLSNAAFRNLAIYTAIASFVMTVLTLFALVFSFKSRIIGSNGLRIALRVFFVLAILIGIINLGYGVVSYLNWAPQYSSLSKPGAPGNEMLQAFEDGERSAGPLTQLGIFFPIGLGFLFFGLSGFSMTKSTGVPEQN